MAFMQIYFTDLLSKISEGKHTGVCVQIGLKITWNTGFERQFLLLLCNKWQYLPHIPLQLMCGRLCQKQSWL